MSRAMSEAKLVLVLLECPANAGGFDAAILIAQSRRASVADTQ